MAKKLLSFFGLAAYAVGTIGGFGYCAYCQAWVPAVAVVLLGVMAFPTAREFFRNLTA